MPEQCAKCGAPLVCLRDRLEVELADMRDVVDLAVKQVRFRYASYDVSEGLDWVAESRKVPYAELARRRHPFEGVTQ